MGGACNVKKLGHFVKIITNLFAKTGFVCVTCVVRACKQTNFREDCAIPTCLQDCSRVSCIRQHAPKGSGYQNLIEDRLDRDRERNGQDHTHDSPERTPER